MECCSRSRFTLVSNSRPSRRVRSGAMNDASAATSFVVELPRRRRDKCHSSEFVSTRWPLWTRMSLLFFFSHHQHYQKDLILQLGLWIMLKQDMQKKPFTCNRLFLLYGHLSCLIVIFQRKCFLCSLFIRLGHYLELNIRTWLGQ